MFATLRPRVLVIDVGGSHVKLHVTGRRDVVRIVSGPAFTAGDMIAAVKAATSEWDYDVVSVGYPGPVAAGRPSAEPQNLGKGWIECDFEAAFGRPIRLLNDAAMQALGGYRGGHMLFLGLGTGLGSALVVDGHLQPLELAHLPYRKGRTFEEYVGEAGRDRLGNRRWRSRVIDVVTRLRVAMQADSVLLGGGNAKRMRDVLDRLPPDTAIGSNADAFRGGKRLWQLPEEVARLAQRRPVPVAASAIAAAGVPAGDGAPEDAEALAS